MKNILILGGDSRNLELANILKKDYKVETYGFNKQENLNEKIKQADAIITAIPITKDGKNVILEFKEKLTIEELINLCENKKIITGKISLENKQKLEQKNNNVIDILKLEEYAILNAQPTAEGAVQLAMENTKKVLKGSNILITGYGKIGKNLAQMLKNLNCNVYAAARKETDFAIMESFGVKPLHYENLKHEIGIMDIIFNTVPHIILNKEELLNIKKQTPIIELASKPGGINLEQAQILNLKIINGQGLPGKVAPQTSAEIIAKISHKYL